MLSKKYYWIKTSVEFFNQDSIDNLLAKKRGCEYVIIYQMLLLMTANTGGYLANSINGAMIPFDIAKIVRETKYFDAEIIVESLSFFRELGLIDVIKDEKSGASVYHIVKIDEMIGSETNYAIEKRKYREKKALKKARRTKENNVHQEDKGQPIK